MVGYMTMKKTLKVQGNVADSLRSEEVEENLACDGSHRGGLEKKGHYVVLESRSTLIGFLEITGEVAGYVAWHDDYFGSQ